jgi:putative hemolysin
MMMLLTGRLPKVADSVIWQDWRFEIVDMDGNTIDTVLATRSAGTEPGTSGDD